MRAADRATHASYSTAKKRGRYRCRCSRDSPACWTQHSQIGEARTVDAEPQRYKIQKIYFQSALYVNRVLSFCCLKEKAKVKKITLE